MSSLPTMSPAGYILGALLGTGSFAEVFLATRVADNVTVAVKRIKTPLARGINIILSRAHTEYALQQHLGAHPNIVQPLDAVRDEDNRLCIVMEYARGGSAQAFMEGTWGSAPGGDDDPPMKLFTASALCRVALHIARALHFVHVTGIIHRDIKPGNIVFDTLVEGGSGIAQLADWGSATIVDDIMETLGGSSMGTPGYSAPEVLDPLRGACSASDVWSLGATLLDMLTGCGAITKTRQIKTSLLLAARDGSSWSADVDFLPLCEEAPRTAWSHAPEDLRTLILSCLVIKPEGRPSAAELLASPLLVEEAVQEEKEAERKRMEVMIAQPLKEQITQLLEDRNADKAFITQLEEKCSLGNKRANFLQLQCNELNESVSRLQNELKADNRRALELSAKHDKATAHSKTLEEQLNNGRTRIAELESALALSSTKAARIVELESALSLSAANAAAAMTVIEMYFHCEKVSVDRLSAAQVYYDLRKHEDSEYESLCTQRERISKGEDLFIYSDLHIKKGLYNHVYVALGVVPALAASLNAGKLDSREKKAALDVLRFILDRVPAYEPLFAATGALSWART